MPVSSEGLRLAKRLVASSTDEYKKMRKVLIPSFAVLFAMGCSEIQPKNNRRLLTPFEYNGECETMTVADAFAAVTELDRHAVSAAYHHLTDNYDCQEFHIWSTSLIKPGTLDYDECGNVVKGEVVMKWRVRGCGERYYLRLTTSPNGKSGKNTTVEDF